MLNVFVLSVFGVVFGGMADGSAGFSVSPDQMDLGDIWQGEIRTVSVELKNQSRNTIDFKVKPSCSCVDIDVSEATLEPGARMTLKAKIVRTEPGRFRDRIVVSDKHNTYKSRIIALTGEARQAYVLGGGWNDTAGQGQQNSADLDPFVPSRPMQIKDKQGVFHLYIRSLRPDDPIIGTDSLEVESSLFKVTGAENCRDDRGMVRAHLNLQLKRDLEPDSYQDTVKIKTPGTVILARKVQFRILGDVWADKATLTVGAVRRDGSPTTKRLSINFRDNTEVWSPIEILRVEPGSYRPAVTVSESNRCGHSVDLDVTLDPAELPPDMQTSDSFFHFILFLGDTERQMDSKVAGGNTVKLHVYGALVR